MWVFSGMLRHFAVGTLTLDFCVRVCFRNGILVSIISGLTPCCMEFTKNFQVFSLVRNK